ncbi:hypothetical protein [Luteolibacter luteus]|uniref:Uncharacterized protein n=1 Tax=Luteolibacter luteus TaxID=2728835 RepID=A0A858RJU4_9BACT|nr:hypothetical protein [Luteolibacter luteus]QJE97546.1 hypothetical protein HHL09_17740 [Luteolibacter luteus]
MISPLNRRRVVGDHLPELIGMELGLQLAAILSLCLTVGWVGRIGAGDAATIAAFSIASILAILGMTRLYQRLKDCIERWEKEYEALEATETHLPD